MNDLALTEYNLEKQ